MMPPPSKAANRGGLPGRRGIGMLSMDQQELRALEQRCIQEEAPECTAACPIHVDGRAFVGHASKGELAGGLRRSTQEHALSGHPGPDLRRALPPALQAQGGRGPDSDRRPRTCLRGNTAPFRPCSAAAPQGENRRRHRQRPERTHCRLGPVPPGVLHLRLRSRFETRRPAEDTPGNRLPKRRSRRIGTADRPRRRSAAERRCRAGSIS